MFEMPSEDDRRPEELLTRRANTTCLSEDELEDYLHNRLSGTTRESIEEHLLYCPSCLTKVTEEEDFATHFRVAARRLEDNDLRRQLDGARSGWLSRLRKWMRRPPATGFTVLFAGALAVAVFVALPSLQKSPVLDVSLVSERGLASGFSAPAAAGRPLRVHLDTTGLTAAQFNLEIAGPANRIIATKSAPASTPEVVWELNRSLDSGTYWVRVYQTNPHTLLREYALVVK